MKASQSSKLARELISRRALAVGRRLTPAVRPLFALVRDVPELVGTCVLLGVNETLFVLSAAHVLDERHRGLLIGGAKGVTDLAGDFISTTLPERGGRSADRNDVGIVRLATGVQRALSDLLVLTPADVDVDDRSSIPGQAKPHYLVLGYPSSKARASISERRVKCEGFILTALPASAATCEKLGVGDHSHVVLDFEQRDVTSVDGRSTAPSLRGVSGGGVWSLGTSFDVEGRHAKLAAIGIEWHVRGPKAIVGTRLALFVEVIRRHCPELSAYIPVPRRIRVKLGGAAV